MLHRVNNIAEKIICISTDITKEYQLKEDLLASDRLIEKERLANELKTQFMGDMSHELRTPLNAINGFSELLKDEIVGTLNEKQKQYIEEIYKGGSHLLKMINTILDISKIEQSQTEVNWQSFDIKVFFEDLKQSLLPILDSKKTSLKINVEEGFIINSDITKLRQILSNIIQNSIKFSAFDSTVILSAEIIGSSTQITVQDFGIGITEEKQRLLFEPFYQVDKNKVADSGIKKLSSDLHSNNESVSSTGVGAGLGLFITRQLVELMNGKISLYSAGLNKGTTVLIDFER
mgnify:CR=1 FL=1